MAYLLLYSQNSPTLSFLKLQFKNEVVPAKAEGFKFKIAGLDDIAVINMNNEFAGNPFVNCEKKGFRFLAQSTFIQMPGEPFYRINLF